MRTSLTVAGLCAVLGCTDAPEPTGSAPAEPAPAESAAPSPEPSEPLAPFPFTPAQIRDATPVGRTYRVRLDLGPGAVVEIQVEFVAVDAEGATMRSTTLAADGKAVGEPRDTRTTWAALQRHASYPAAGTVIERDTVEAPAGSFECRRYTSTTTTEDGERVERAWFADALPGAPVRHEVTVAGERISLMELLEHRRP